MVHFSSLHYGLLCLEIICRRSYYYIIHRAQYGIIMQTMVGCTQGTITDSCAYAYQFDGVIRISDIIFYLLQGPAVRKQAGETANTFLPADASPAATPTRFCSAMPISTICLGKFCPNGVSLPDPRESLVTTIISLSFPASF